MINITEEYKALLQFELNEQMKQCGVEKFHKSEERLEKLEGFGETKVGKAASSQFLKGFSRKYQDELNYATKRHILKRLGLDNSLHPELIGRIVFSIVFGFISSGSSIKFTTTSMIMRIGKEVERSLNGMYLDIFHQDKVHRLMDKLKKWGLAGDKDRIQEEMEKLSESKNVEHVDWDESTKLQLGMLLFEIFMHSDVPTKLSEELLYEP